MLIICKDMDVLPVDMQPCMDALVLIIGSVEVGPDIDMKFHQEVMEIVSYDNNIFNNHSGYYRLVINTIILVTRQYTLGPA